MAVALVIFARWDPIRCLLASLLFGAVGSLGLALQGQHLASASTGYLWNVTPYVLTLWHHDSDLVAGQGHARRPGGTGPGALTPWCRRLACVNGKAGEPRATTQMNRDNAEA